jgi:hypothetical protein
MDLAASTSPAITAITSWTTSENTDHRTAPSEGDAMSQPAVAFARAVTRCSVIN